jgi:S1-C subfamily serine protease
MGETVTGTLANRYSLPLGVYVTSVEENSPAFAAGIQAGDVITAVGDESILTFNEFSEKIYKLGSGQKTTINVKRRARDGYYDIAFTVTLANKD